MVLKVQGLAVAHAKTNDVETGGTEVQINPTLHFRSAVAHPNLLNFRSHFSSYFFSPPPLLRVAQTLETAMGSDRWRPNLPAKGRAPLRLAAAAAVAAGIAAAAAAAADPEIIAADPGENLRIAVDGVVRSSRAIYTVGSLSISSKNRIATHCFT